MGLETESKTGRPTKMTKATLGKLRGAFLMGSTDEEACVFAQIHPSTLYDYQQQNPDFSEEKEVWKMKPILKSRRLSLIT
jgi:hypothetical protein